MENGENGVNPQRPASPAEQLIPKSRLDEVLAERNRLREERNLQDRTVQTLSQLLQQQRGAPKPQAQEHPLVKKLKEQGREEDAMLFQSLMRENQQVRQAQAAMIDDMDRTKFLTQYGAKGGYDKLQEVERIVEAERQRGNFQVTREGAFMWLLGNERLLKDERAESRAIQQAAAPAPQAKPQQAAPEDVPSMDPADIASVRQGGVSDSWSEKSREERIKELENIEF